MKQVDRALIEAEEEAAPPNGAGKKDKSSAPLKLPSHLRAGNARPELAALGWESRGQRLTGKK